VFLLFDIKPKSPVENLSIFIIKETISVQIFTNN